METSSLLAAANSTLPNATSIQGFAAGFAAGAQSVIETIDAAVIAIATVGFVTLIVLGVVLWFSRLSRHLGKELVEGGVVIAIFIEFVYPVLQHVHL